MFRMITITPLVLLMISQLANAATVLDIADKTGSRSKVMIDGNRARIDMGGDQGYVLIDNSKNTMLAVMPAQKQILDMSGDTPLMGGSRAAPVKIDLVAKGGGPEVAGYATRIFELKGNGKYCGTLFGSKDALKTAGMEQLFESMKNMMEKQRAAMGSYAAMIGVCTRAHMDFASQTDKVGVPMKVLDENGGVMNEIIGINTNASVPANAFDAPEGYKTITIAEQMGSAKRSIEQAQRQMPDMQKMMEQMQQMQKSGRVPPEVMEQMKRYQEQMQQRR